MCQVQIKKTSCFCLLCLTVVFALLLFVRAAFGQNRPVKIETRAVFIHPEQQFSADPENGKQEVQQLVDRLAKANFNLIFPWLRSEYLAALTDQRYQNQVPIAKWDAIAELVRAARQKGIEVYLWYSFTHYKSKSSPDFDPLHGGNPRWAARKIDELVPDPNTGTVRPLRMEDICPNYPEGRAWQAKQIENALARYQSISGVLIEEPGYGYPGYCVCDLCLRLLKQDYGWEGVKDIEGEEAEDLRCRGTTEFMKNLHISRQKFRPNLILSTTGGFDWKADRRLGRDWRNWARLGWLDIYLPQIYVPSLELFSSRLQKTMKDLGKDCLVFPVIAAHKNTPEMVVKQINIARQLGVQGIAIFHGKVLTDEYLKALKDGPFKDPAVPNFH